MKLWPKGLVRHIRFHDLRHTYGSVLLMFGANLVSVQRLLGHSDSRITKRCYGHLLPDFMQAEVNRLRFGLDRLAPPLPANGRAQADGGSRSQALAGLGSPLGTPVVQPGRKSQKQAGTPSGNSEEIPASELARDTGFEPVAFGSGEGHSTLAMGINGSQPLANVGYRAASKGTQFPDLVSFRPPLGTSLVQPEAHCQSLPKCLTVKEAARALRVSTATVYRLVEEGRIEHTRVSNAIRIPEKGLEALLGRGA
jgi:excisionase family DNA binding protein